MGMNAVFPVNPATKVPLPEADGPDTPRARELIAARLPFRCKMPSRMLEWTIPYLTQKIGHVPREVTRVRTKERVSITTAELLALIEKDPGWKATYLPEAGPPLDLMRPEYRVLCDDFAMPSYVSDKRSVAVMIRNSNANANREYYDTPCHYELNIQPAIYVQVLGKKHLWLFSPDESQHLGVESFMTEAPYVSNMAEACVNPSRYPQLARATCYEAVLEPGDFVYWPEFWFHWFVHYHEFQINLRVDWDVPRFELNSMSASWAYTNALADALGGFAHLSSNFAALPPETRELLTRIEQTIINSPRVLDRRIMTTERFRLGMPSDQTAYQPPKP